MTKDEWYGVLTTKEPVAVTQGGTGAKTTEEARAKLSVPSRDELINGDLVVGKADTADTAAKATKLVPVVRYNNSSGGPRRCNLTSLGDDLNLAYLRACGTYQVTFKYKKNGMNTWRDGVSVLSVSAGDRPASGTLCAIEGDDGEAMGTGAYARYYPPTESPASAGLAPAYIEVANFGVGELVDFQLLAIKTLI